MHTPTTSAPPPPALSAAEASLLRLNREHPGYLDRLRAAQIKDAIRCLELAGYTVTPPASPAA